MLTIDPTSNTPPYEQMRSQIIAQIDAGQLEPGAKLPAVRRLAGDLGLAANTVARAYRELEQEGYVRTAGRNGTIVAAPHSDGDVTERAQDLARRYVAELRALGFDPDATLAVTRRAIANAR